MKVLRNTKWNYEGILDGLLKFREMRFSNSYVLVERCKYVDVARNKVHYMSVSNGELVVTDSANSEANNSDSFTQIAR